MLHQQNPSRVSSDTMYLAFRAAFVTTIEEMYRDLHDSGHELPSPGFLERLPLLAGCAPQIQLECLLETWRRLESGFSNELSELDRCICYCAAAELAQLGILEDTRRIELALAGPRKLEDVDCLWLASKLRTIQITWPFEQDCSVILRDGNFLDGDLDVMPAVSLHVETASQMLELSGRWCVSPHLLSNAMGLGSEAERSKLSAFFQHNAGLMNL